MSQQGRDDLDAAFESHTSFIVLPETARRVAEKFKEASINFVLLSDDDFFTLIGSTASPHSEAATGLLKEGSSSQMLIVHSDEAIQ